MDEMVRDLDQVADFLFGLKRIQSQPKAREWIEPDLLRAVRVLSWCKSSNPAQRLSAAAREWVAAPRAPGNENSFPS